jgi:tRNA dimethylallyltransferase
MPDMAARAIGYRQTIDYLQDQSEDSNGESGFNSYMNDFTTATRRYAKKQMSWFRKDKDFMFVPVSLQLEKSNRVEESASKILQYCALSREDYEKELLSEESASAISKKSNEEQGKKMKFYQFERHILKVGTNELDECFSKAVECREKMQQNKKQRIEK